MSGQPSAWSLVVPVKRLAVAKSRLGAFSPHTRAELAMAFAADVVTAALSCPAVVAVVVVTDEPLAVHELGALGARVVADHPHAGINAALLYGARAALATGPCAALGALASDLPAMRPADLSTALAGASRFSTAFVADAAGTGTTLFTARRVEEFAPAFGAGSAARHRGRGAVELRDDVPSLRRDVDTEADLRAAVGIGVGRRTAAVALRLGLTGHGK